MKNSIKRFLLGNLCLVMHELVSVPAWGQTTPSTVVAEPQAASCPSMTEPLEKVLTGDAKREYSRALMLVEVHEHAAAAIKFRRAYALQSDPRLLREIAVCEKDLRHYARALGLVRDYREKAQCALTPQEVENLRELEEVFQGLTSEMTVLVSEADATILVDGDVVGIAPLSKPIRVDLGQRRITIQKPSFKTVEFDRTVEGGVPLRLVADLQREWRRGRLIVQSDAKDMIAIDGKPLALGRYDGQLNAGGHNIRVSAPGMIPSQMEISLRENEVRTLRIELVPLQKSFDPTKMMWIGGGVALLTGAIIGGAASYRSADKPLESGTLGNQYVGPKP